MYEERQSRYDFKPDKLKLDYDELSVPPLTGTGLGLATMSLMSPAEFLRMEAAVS